MRISLIQVPYHLGREDVSVAKGPIRLLEIGLEEGLRKRGFDVVVRRAVRKSPFATELEAITEINSQVSMLVREAVSEGRFPIILGGDCNSSLGAFAALDTSRIGLVWFDAHGDFNTPQTTPSGFLDGMALAIATGRCYPDQWRAMGAASTLTDSHILLVGVRDLDEAEQTIVDQTDVMAVFADDFGDPDHGFAATLEALRSRTDQVFVHVDIDAVDPEEAPGGEYQTPHGLSASQLEGAIEQIGNRFELSGANFASFSPDFDRQDRTVKLVSRLIETIAETAQR